MNWSALPSYEKVYALVRLIPSGEVATYGQIAGYIAGVTPRMVGYALFALEESTDVPWQRVINAQGEISPRAGETGSGRQRVLLEKEGVRFNAQGRIDLAGTRWSGPGPAWLAERDLLL